MTIQGWLEARTPRPPQELAERIGSAVADRRGEASGGVLETLESAALDALDEARRRPGRVRDSAYHLLTADALLTYACEAALDRADPDAALRGLVERASSPRR